MPTLSSLPHGESKSTDQNSQPHFIYCLHKEAQGIEKWLVNDGTRRARPRQGYTHACGVAPCHLQTLFILARHAHLMSLCLYQHLHCCCHYFLRLQAALSPCSVWLQKWTDQHPSHPPLCDKHGTMCVTLWVQKSPAFDARIATSLKSADLFFASLSAFFAKANTLLCSSPSRFRSVMSCKSFFFSLYSSSVPDLHCKNMQH